MKKLFACFALLLILAAHAFAQWTEPIPMDPQFGVGVRGVWISNDNLRLYIMGGLSTLSVTTRETIGSAWGPLVTLPHHINFTGTQNSVCESPSGDTLYFTSDSDQRPGQEGYGWLDVYYCVRSDTGWGPAINCGDSVNGPGQEWSVNISRDGSLLLLSSNGSNGEYNSHKLWYCMKHTDGTWGFPVLFGDSLNTWMHEESPSLAPDNSRLLFYREDSYTRDLMESRMTGEHWRSPTPLPPPVNILTATDKNPCLANDGRTLWFRSDRSGQNQIYTSIDTSSLSMSPQGGLHRNNSVHHMVSIYPNPTNGRLYLAEPLGSVTALSVYNVLGQVVMSLPVPRGSNGPCALPEIDALATGAYFLKVQSRAGEVVQKFVVAR
jgi:Tol biopolymer transport system component